jgi:hypothetical protein
MSIYVSLCEELLVRWPALHCANKVLIAFGFANVVPYR